jgi:transmembrane sensor
MTDDALDIMEPEAEISDQMVEKLNCETDLAEACRDIALAASAQRRKQEKVDVEARLNQFHRRHHQRKIIKLSIIGIMTAAAIFAGLLFILKYQNNTNQIFFNAEDLSETAMLTDIDGNEIPFKLSKNHGVEIKVGAKKDDASTDITDTLKMNMPFGKSCIIDLPDGSKVYLHPGSNMVYPTRFTGSLREVKLYGEAYFIIAHDKNHPFVVTTANSQTTVLGTEFDITSYHGQAEKVTLVTGSIKLHGQKCNREICLVPGQEASINEGGGINVTDIDTEPFTSWRDGYFYFDNVPLRDILQELGRYYNVSIDCNSSNLLNYRMRFIIKRDNDINYVVSMLNRMKKFNAILTDNKIEIR